MDSTETFRYRRPIRSRRKTFSRLVHTDQVLVAVQTLQEGGENNLHSHVHLDGIWFVLSGEATFYTTGDEVIRTLRSHEGIRVPRGYPYWFENSGHDALEILQLEVRDTPEPDRAKFDVRVNHEPLRAATVEAVEVNVERA